MSRTDTRRYSDAAAVTHPAVQPIAARLGRNDADIVDSPSGARAMAKDPRTLAPDSGQQGPRRTGLLRAGRFMAGERQRLSAGMTTTLSAELEGRVARDLVADIVRAVVDESRQTAQDRTAESLLAEARQRLERFIRARAYR